MIITLLATLFIKAIPLRDTLHETPVKEQVEDALESAGPISPEASPEVSEDEIATRRG